MSMKVTILAVILLASQSQLTLAQELGDRSIDANSEQKFFTTLDTDGDGVIDAKEMNDLVVNAGAGRFVNSRASCLS